MGYYPQNYVMKMTGSDKSGLSLRSCFKAINCIQFISYAPLEQFCTKMFLKFYPYMFYTVILKCR